MDINILTLLNIVKKGKKYFLFVFALTFVLSTAISFILPVIYASKTVLFVLNPKSYDPRSKFSQMEIYGSVEDINRTIALAESGQIRDSIVKKFNLATHYKIDPANIHEVSKIEQEYTTNLEVIETNKGAVKITFYDQSPDTAAAVVNEIVRQINIINKEVIKDAILKQYATYKKVMQEKYYGLDSLNDILANVAKDRPSSSLEVNSMEMFHAFSRLNETEVNLQTIRDDVQTVQVIEKGIPVWKKEKPKRMVIVAIACLSTFIITLLFLLFKDRKDFEELDVKR